MKELEKAIEKVKQSKDTVYSLHFILSWLPSHYRHNKTLTAKEFAKIIERSVKEHA